MSDDIIQFQRLASGYCPGKSETFAAAVSPKSGKFQNCTVVRGPGAISATGVFDVLIGPKQDTPSGETALRSSDGPAPVGIGGVQVNDPPLNVAGGGIIADQGRVSVNVRGTLTNPATSVNPQVTIAVVYGASFGATPIYAGFSNTQLVRLMFANSGGDATDVDFDFSIERVLDPNQEP